MSKNRKTSFVVLPYLRDESTLALRWMVFIYWLMFNDLSTIWKFRLFSFERKVAPIYAILVRSVLHIYAVGLYIYTLPPFAVTLFPTRVPHPLLGISTLYSRVSEETPPTVCTRLAACVHTPFRFYVFRPLYIVYIYKKVPVTERCLLMKQRGNRNVGFITVGCKIVSGSKFQVPSSKPSPSPSAIAIAISHRHRHQPSLLPSAIAIAISHASSSIQTLPLF